MTADMQQLADSLGELCRPGITVEAAADRLRFQVVARRAPQHVLWSVLARWKVAPDPTSEARVIRGFDAFNDAVAALIERVRRTAVTPIIVGQDLFNAGVMRNPHWLDVLELELEHVEMDAARWRDA